MNQVNQKNITVALLATVAIIALTLLFFIQRPDTAIEPLNETVEQSVETFANPALEQTSLYTIREWDVSLDTSNVTGFSYEIVESSNTGVKTIDFTTEALALTDCAPFRIIRGPGDDILNNGDPDVVSFSDNFNRSKNGFESQDPRIGLSLLLDEFYYANGPAEDCSSSIAQEEYQKLRSSFDGSFSIFNV